MSLFYSQNCEDVLLARCFEGQTTGFYVDVGAEDPIEGSITKHFSERGWTGINIEPVPFFFEKIKKDRPNDINLPCVASNRDDASLELCVAEGSGLSTLDNDRKTALQSQEALGVHTIEVESLTLNTILERHHKGRLDFLKIDVEGHELAVLQGIDLNQYRPRVVIIETTTPLIHPEGGRVPMPTRPQHASDYGEIQQILSQAHYELVYFDGLNTWWIDPKEPSLRKAFQTPANCFDTISPMETHRLIDQYQTREVDIRAEAEERVKAIDQRLQDAHQQIDALNLKINESHAQYQELSETHRQLALNHEAVLNSRSWKITAPLRRVTDRVRRAKEGE